MILISFKGHKLLIITLGIAAIYPVDGAPCDGIQGGLQVGDRCVWLSPVIDKNQTEARAHCKSVIPGADLAVVDSNEKYSALQDVVAAIGHGYAWMGVHDRDPSIGRDWRWFDGRVMRLEDFTWKSDNPNGLSLDKPDSIKGIQECIMVEITFLWHDMACSNIEPYAICECCYPEPEIQTAKYKRTGPSSGADKGKQLRCAVQCKTDPSCYTYWYNPGTGQCEYNTPKALANGFMRELADVA